MLLYDYPGVYPGHVIYALFPLAPWWWRRGKILPILISGWLTRRTGGGCWVIRIIMWAAAEYKAGKTQPYLQQKLYF